MMAMVQLGVIKSTWKIKFLHAKRNIYGHVFFVIYGRIDERIIKEWVEITKNIISRLSL